ncbi:MAG: hypothetical protein V3V96_15470 [Acidiferrobacterales bacterium]
MTSASDFAKAARTFTHRIHCESKGLREQIVCKLPNGYKRPLLILNMEDQLIMSFGGFTRTPMIGAWDSGSDVTREVGYVYDVSFIPNGESFRIAYDIFVEAALAMGEKSVHIERHFFTAFHAE